MKELANNILAQIEVDISEIDLYGYDIIETSLSMVHKLQTVLDELRVKIQTYIFPTKEDEILFFKTKKPELHDLGNGHVIRCFLPAEREAAHE